MAVVTLYTKLGCHLCEATEAEIAAVARRRRFEFVRVDITHDPDDFEKYRYDIPVVLVNGIEVARHALTAGQLERALREAP